VFIDELLSKLNEATGIKYTVSSIKLEPGKIDRSYAAQYLSKVCEKIRAESPDIKTPDDKDPNAQLDFLIGIFRQKKIPKKDLDIFRTNMMNGFKVGQRNASRLLDELQKQVGTVKEEGLIGFLGITEADIYDKDNNYLFGLARTGFAVMSYCRFKGDFNQEPQQRRVWLSVL